MILSLLAALPILGYTGGAVGLSKMAGLKGPKLSRAAKAAFIRSTGIKTSKQAKDAVFGFTTDKSQKAQKSPQKQEVPPKQYTKVMP